jgi:hypothetical protein
MQIIAGQQHFVGLDPEEALKKSILLTFFFLSR